MLADFEPPVTMSLPRTPPVFPPRTAFAVPASVISCCSVVLRKIFSLLPLVLTPTDAPPGRSIVSSGASTTTASGTPPTPEITVPGVRPP